MTPYHAYRRTFIFARWRILQYTKGHTAARQRHSESGTITLSEGVWEHVIASVVTVIIMMVSGDAATTHKRSEYWISYPLCFWYTFFEIMYISFWPLKLEGLQIRHHELVKKHDRFQQLSGFHWKDQACLSSFCYCTQTYTHIHSHTRHLKAWLAWLAMGRNRLWLLIAAWRWICVSVCECVYVFTCVSEQRMGTKGSVQKLLILSSREAMCLNQGQFRIVSPISNLPSPSTHTWTVFTFNNTPITKSDGWPIKLKYLFEKRNESHLLDEGIILWCQYEGSSWYTKWHQTARLSGDVLGSGNTHMNSSSFSNQYDIFLCVEWYTPSTETQNNIRLRNFAADKSIKTITV